MPEMKTMDRNQFVFCSLDSVVDEESIARIIDRFVENLDLEALDFQKTETSKEGRPRYPIKGLLKLYIYGQQKDIRTSRKLEDACRLNIEVKWLMEGLEPDYRTIANFRRDNIKCMKKVFHEFNHKLVAVVEKGYLSVDGSKFQANNSKDRNFTANKLDDRIKWLDRHIEEYIRQMDELDRADDKVEEVQKKAEEAEKEANQEEDKPLSETFTREELDEKLKEAQERLELYKGYRDLMEENGLSQLSLTDADAKLMKNKNGFAVAYNLQTAVDSGTHLIDDYQMTNQPTDHGLLESTVHEERERRGGIVEVVADKGYQQAEDMAKCLENGIIPNVILPDEKDSYEIELPYEEAEVTEEELKSRAPEDLKKCLRAGKIPEAYKGVISDIEVKEKRRAVKEDEEADQSDSPYGTEEEMIERAKEGYFVRNPEKNIVYCPTGEILRQKCIKKNGEIRYANKTACKHCPHRNRCYKGKNSFREVDFNKDTLERANRNWLEAAADTAGTAETGKETSDAKADAKGSKKKKKRRYEKYKAVVFKLIPDRVKMSQRMCLSEHPFGTIKRAMNGGYFLLKGLEKVDGEAALFCLGYNIKRAMNLLGFEKMMAAMA